MNIQILKKRANLKAYLAKIQLTDNTYSFKNIDQHLRKQSESSMPKVLRLMNSRSVQRASLSGNMSVRSVKEEKIYIVDS